MIDVTPQPAPGDHRACNARIAELEAALQKALDRVAKLEERARQNSSNSSRPPSTDPADAPKKPHKPPSGRQPGGQPGHEIHLRTPIPPERVTGTVVVKPTRCWRCGKTIRGEATEPRRHQVVELPEIKPDVTEYILHDLDCRCGQHVVAELPEGVPTGNFGPRLQATVAALTGDYHMSKRQVPVLLKDVLGIEMSVGSVTACEAAVAAALEKPVAEALAYVQEQAVGNADETGWRERRLKAWLWVLTTTLVTVFMIHAKRGKEAARKLLGAFHGILGTDRWCAYNQWATEKRQLCWAHLLRHFVAMSECRGTAATIGKDLLRRTKRMFGWWDKVRDGTIKRETFHRYMAPVRLEIEDLLEAGAACRHKKTAGRCAEILKLREALWTFVDAESVEPTNNAAERAIRHAVLWRKGSFGTHSEAGSRFVERIMTVRATLRQQGRNVLAFIAAACEARLKRQVIPSLLPAQAS